MIIAQILQSTFGFGTVKLISIITLMTNPGQFIFPLFLKFRQEKNPFRSLNLEG